MARARLFKICALTKVKGGITFSKWITFLDATFSAIIRSSCLGMSCKKESFKISKCLQEKTCARPSFLINLQALAWKFIQKETLAQVFSCKFPEIFKKASFIEHLWWLLLYHKLKCLKKKHIEQILKVHFTFLTEKN